MPVAQAAFLGFTMNDNIININVPNAISIIVMSMLGMVLLGFLRKKFGRSDMIGGAPGSDAPGR